MGNIPTDLRIGTSGYDYPEWRGWFYPEDLDRRDFLDYYCSQFSSVELNFSYYRMPNEQQLSKILRRSRGAVDFSIKTHRSLTHQVDPHRWRDDAAQYCRAIAPLAEADALAAVLIQLPWSFQYDPERRAYLDKLLAALSPFPRVVEFRNAQWISDRVFEALTKRQVGFACLDLPQLKGLPTSVDRVTAPLAYVRFHGRNHETWWGGDAASRFDYLYSQSELQAWTARIGGLMETAHSLRIYFNNHRHGQAPTNARMLMDLLKEADIGQPAGT